MLVLAESNGAVHERLAGELAGVEARFAEELLSDLDCVNELVAHVERYRGKMLRPTLVLLTAMATSPDKAAATPAQLTVATVVEMVHMATLVHDDILDDAQMRRRGATINHLAGNEAAVMLGDYLISHAYHLCSSINDAAISRLIADATNTVCEGELLQLANRNNWSLDERTYFEIIRRKTASLCGTCCRVAATLSGAASPIADAMYLYGEQLGVAFQIVDDLLDLTGEESTVGKTIGRDLAKGKLTLPLIRHLATASEQHRAALLQLLEAQAGEEDAGAQLARAAQIRQRLRSSDAIPYARQCAAGLVHSTKQAVTKNLAPSPARALMLDMADAVLSREF